MSAQPAFTVCAYTRDSAFLPGTATLHKCQSRAVARRYSRTKVRMQPRADAVSPTPEDYAREEQRRALERMRSRLEGLFGVDEEKEQEVDLENFDGSALRSIIRERWGVQYDIQPQKRLGRVYVQIMWRYFEQQSFYMEEEEFASHCEAVAQLLQKWNAVDYFCDYVASIKKRPVVGIAINIPIPGVTAESAAF